MSDSNSHHNGWPRQSVTLWALCRICHTQLFRVVCWVLCLPLWRCCYSLNQTLCHHEQVLYIIINTGAFQRIIWCCMEMDFELFSPFEQQNSASCYNRLYCCHIKCMSPTLFSCPLRPQSNSPYWHPVSALIWFCRLWLDQWQQQLPPPSPTPWTWFEPECRYTTNAAIQHNKVSSSIGVWRMMLVFLD